MNILNKYNDVLNGIFSDWIQIKDDKNSFTIENFPYDTGAVSDSVKPHCQVCTAINYCWFKNEENKRPKEMEYRDLSKFNRANRGLYHPYCHCKKRGLNPPKVKDIILEMGNNKINYFFKDKGELFYAWGYKKEDKNEFVKSLKLSIINSYIKGEYANGSYNDSKDIKYGFRINIFVTLNGGNEKCKNRYNLKAGFIVYPNGKLRNITPLVRR